MLRTQKAVMANLDRRVSGGHMRRAAKQYRTGVVQPLVEVLKGSQSANETLRRLNVDLFRGMNATTLIEAVADAYVQSAMIGRASALPRAPAFTPGGIPPAMNGGARALRGLG